MAPARRKGSGRSSAAVAAAARQQWKVGDLVLAKMKGFPAWPAMISEPKKWGYSSDRKNLLVYFYGTKQIAFCNYADVEAFTEDKKKSLLTKRQGKGADFLRALDEIVDIFEKLKRQEQDKFNTVDEGPICSAGNSEGLKYKSFDRSPEVGPLITHNHQAEALSAYSENQDVLDTEEIPATFEEGDPQDLSAIANEPSGTIISILDQLRQTPLSSSTNSRKRRRDARPQNCAILGRLPSLQRSRTSSGGPHKCSKPTTILNDNNVDGCDQMPDAVQEDSVMTEKLIDKVPNTLASSEAMPDSAGLPLNDTGEDVVPETTAMEAEIINLNDGIALEPSSEVKYPGNGNVGPKLNGDVRDKLGKPTKAIILKKKRKPNRKRVDNTSDCAKLNQETMSNVELGRSLLESPNSLNGINEGSLNVDGDEHLPLVKRARVRMGKPHLDEAQLGDSVGVKAGSDTEASVDKSVMFLASNYLGNNCPADRTAPCAKEVSNSSSVNDCIQNSGRDQMSWKPKSCLKDIALHSEAALPPSKRLHRALEAMSANAAEATDDYSEAPSTMDVIHKDANSPKTSIQPFDGNLLGNSTCDGPARIQIMQSSDGDAFNTRASISCLYLTSQNVHLPIKTSSELKPNEILNVGIVSSNEVHHTHDKESNGPSISGMIDIDVHDKNLQSFPTTLIDKQKRSTSGEGMSDQLPLHFGEVNIDKMPQTQFPLPLVKENANHLPSRLDKLGGDGAVLKLDLVLSSKGRDELLPQGATLVSSPIVARPPASDTLAATKYSNSQSNGISQAADMHDAAKYIKQSTTPKDWVISPDMTPMKDLIAAAQAKRLLSRSTSFSDSTAVAVPYAVVSPSLVHREESSGHGSSSTSTVFHTPVDDKKQYLRSGSKSPHSSLRQKGLEKFSRVDANAARKNFEALLCTLSRTKESIGRATRLATECAKYGIAGEVIEILLQNLERESSLHRRVDLLFLVDSIVQCSRSQKGGAGDVYLSLVQSMLPRLLSAAAPPGSAASENRRQCLKVLRVWLERKTIQESIIRHHIRELEYVTEVSYSSAYSRRPARTERAFNDPLREMEGMLVDEYGSNTGFQLPSFLSTHVLEDEGSSDDEKSFEAVTPESTSEGNNNVKGTTQAPTDKHHHVLEEVDGELEMEDLAPPYEAKATSCHVNSQHHHLDHHPSLHLAPPLPMNTPPSPPPLPASPPPMEPLGPAPPQETGPHAHNVNNNMQSKLPNNLDASLTSSASMSFSTQGYGGLLKQHPLPSPVPSLISSNNSYSTHTENKKTIQTLITVPLHPPPPMVSNQFSYVQAEPRQMTRGWQSCSSDRFQYVHDHHQRGNFYGDRGTRGPIQHEIPERSRFSRTGHLGPAHPEKCEAPPASRPLFGSPVEHSQVPCHGWPLPCPVPASRLSLETNVTRVAGAPGYWGPR